MTAVYPALLGVLARRVLEPVFGAPYLSTARWLQTYFAWPDERRAAWRQERFEEVVGHARRAVPFYRELLGAERDLSQIALTDLPPTDKARMRSAPDAFLSEGWQEIPHIEKRTGGSTGDPWAYPLDKRAWTHQYAAALHFYGRLGHRYGDKVLLLGAPPSLGVEDAGLKSRVRRTLERTDASLTGWDVDPDVSARRARGALRAGASLWYGHAGTIAAMADAALELGLAPRPPRAIVTTAEPLQPAWARRIESAFGTAPYDQYGCNDGGVLAQTCRHGRFHLAENVSIVEVLDADRPCPPGVEGDVAVTNLHARTLPFLRYRTGDRAVLAAGACPCGVAGATLAGVAGRIVDRLRMPDGSTLSGLAFGHIFMDTPNVRRWQVVQARPERLSVRLDVDDGYGEAEAQLIEREVRSLAGIGVEVVLEPGVAMERTAGGKHKLVVTMAP